MIKPIPTSWSFSWVKCWLFTTTDHRFCCSSSAKIFVNTLSGFRWSTTYPPLNFSHSSMDNEDPSAGAHWFWTPGAIENPLQFSKKTVFDIKFNEFIFLLILTCENHYSKCKHKINLYFKRNIIRMKKSLN